MKFMSMQIKQYPFVIQHVKNVMTQGMELVLSQIKNVIYALMDTTSSKELITAIKTLHRQSHRDMALTQI